MEKSVKSSATSYGVILGVILSLYTVIGYAFYLEMFTIWWVSIILIMMAITIGILSSIQSKKLLNGFISFKSAFTSYFITIVLGTIIGTVISILLFNIIDPETAITIKENIIEMTIGMMEKFGAPKEAVNEAITKMEKENPFALSSQIFNWFKAMVFYIIVGLLSSLAIKKNDPSL